MWTNAIIGILIPLIGTTAGSALVFFLRGEMRPWVQKLLLGFASGVMIAASVWSLLIPAIDMAEEQGSAAWVPAAVGFLLGVGFLLLLDSVVPHQHLDCDRPEGCPSGLGKSAMLTLAVTLHNLPEGMAVGVVFAAAMQGEGSLSLASAFALSAGIAMQNLPEGAVISMPLAGRRGLARPGLPAGLRLRRRGARRRASDHTAHGAYNARAALYPRLRRGRDALRRHRGADTREPVRRALEHRHRRRGDGLCADDDSRRRARLRNNFLPRAS